MISTAGSPQQQQQQQQFQLVPHYGTASPAQAGYSYNNYGLSPNHPPSQSDRRTSFASPPAPSWHEIQSEFAPAATNSAASAPLIDLLDSTPIPQQPILPQSQEETDHQLALRLAAQWEREDADRQRALQTSSTSPPTGVSQEIVSSQERALVQARERNQHEQPTTTTIATTSSSTALVVPVQVPPSLNPSGSDAVHPARPHWKESRGTKTAAGATTGAIVGGIAFGPAFPVGMVLGGAAGGYAVNKMSKTGERRAQRKWEQANFQKGTQESLAIRQDAPLV